MSTLNILPNGNPAPQYRVTATAKGGDETHTVLITEWWNDGKLVETIEESAQNFFYDAFDKHPFKITKIERINISNVSL